MYKMFLYSLLFLFSTLYSTVSRINFSSDEAEEKFKSKLVKLTCKIGAINTDVLDPSIKFKNNKIPDITKGSYKGKKIVAEVLSSIFCPTGEIECTYFKVETTDDIKELFKNNRRNCYFICINLYFIDKSKGKKE